MPRGYAYAGSVTALLRFCAVVGPLILIVMAAAVTITALVLVVAPVFVHP